MLQDKTVPSLNKKDNIMRLVMLEDGDIVKTLMYKVQMEIIF